MRGMRIINSLDNPTTQADRGFHGVGEFPAKIGAFASLISRFKREGAFARTHTRMGFHQQFFPL